VEDEKTDEEEEPVQEAKDVHARSSFPRSCGSRQGGGSRPTPARASTSQAPWPEGKTVKGYAFVKRDDVHSDRPPLGNCYICTSPNHYARNCPHYGTWISMRDVNLIDTDVDSIQEAEDLKGWLVMMVEINGTDSIYGRELSKLLSQIPVAKNVHTVEARATGTLTAHLPSSQHHRNARRRERAEAAVRA
jgi:hypothetical protein